VSSLARWRGRSCARHWGCGSDDGQTDYQSQDQATVGARGAGGPAGLPGGGTVCVCVGGGGGETGRGTKRKETTCTSLGMGWVMVCSLVELLLLRDWVVCTGACDDQGRDKPLSSLASTTAIPEQSVFSGLWHMSKMCRMFGRRGDFYESKNIAQQMLCECCRTLKDNGVKRLKRHAEDGNEMVLTSSHTNVRYVNKTEISLRTHNLYEERKGLRRKLKIGVQSLESSSLMGWDRRTEKILFRRCAYAMIKSEY